MTLARSSHTPLDYLVQSAQSFPDHALTLMLLASQCERTAKTLASCPSSYAAACRDEARLRTELARCPNDAAQRLAEVDPANAFPWALRAVRSYEQQDKQSALVNLQKASNLQRYDDYYARQPLAYDMAARTHLPDNDQSRLLGAYAASFEPLDMISMCIAESRDDLGWREACHQLGDLMASQGDSLAANLLGAALVVKILELDGDPAALSAARERRQRFREVRPSPDIAVLMESDESFLLDYFQYLAEHGERAAQAYAEAELIRRQEGRVDSGAP